MDTAHSIEVLTMSTSSHSENLLKDIVPLHVDMAKFPILSRGEGSKLRRPVRPIDRQRMRPWLMELLDLGDVFGLRWMNRHQGIFQISWRHASRLGWNLETDGDVFERWAKHTGIYKEGDVPEPKRWKANFRCALHSLHDVVELTNAVERRGRNACRTYRFLQSSDEQSMHRKRSKAKRIKYFQKVPQEKSKQLQVILESGSNESILSDAESEGPRQDKVIVQKLGFKPEIPAEDFCLHHDHDYAGPDKTQKTIVLRQGVGSIVLHQEIQNAPEAVNEVENLLMSNLDQLASAAVNSAEIELVQLKEADCNLIEENISRNLKSNFMKIPQVSVSADPELNQSDFNLKQLFIRKRVHDPETVRDEKYIIKKQKSLSLPDKSVHVNFTLHESATTFPSENKRPSLCVSAQVEVNCENKKLLEFPLQSMPTRQRTSSPKILCRRSKQIKVKGDKNMSQPTEPLMSSCLLLLEAATRLDNAEKTETISTSTKSSLNKQYLKGVSQGYEQTGIGNSRYSDHSKLNTDDCVQTSQICRRQADDLNWTEYNSGTTCHGILRTTLENADMFTDSGKALSKSVSMNYVLKDTRTADVITSGGAKEEKVIASGAACATGLFSGSKILSDSPHSLKWSRFPKHGRSFRLSSSKLHAHKPINVEQNAATSSSCDRAVNHNISEECLFNNISAVGSNCSVQKLVIQSQLPVLNMPLNKTLTSTLDTLSPIAVEHTLSSSCNIPQVCVSAANDSMKPTPWIKISDKDCMVQGNEAPDHKEQMSFTVPLSISSSSIVKEKKQLLSQFSSNENSHMLNRIKTDTTVVPVVGSSNISNSSVGSETCSIQSVAISTGSFSESPVTVLRKMTLLATSHQSASLSSIATPLKDLPVCLHGEKEISSESTNQIPIHLTTQNVIPAVPASAVTPSFVITDLHNISVNRSFSAQKEDDVSIFQPENKGTNEIKLHILPLTCSKIRTDTYTPSSSDSLKGSRFQNISELTVPSDAEEMLFSSIPLQSSLHQNQSQLVPHPCHFTSADNAAKQTGEKPSLPVIINVRIDTKCAAATSNTRHRMSDKIFSAGTVNAYSERNCSSHKLKVTDSGMTAYVDIPESPFHCSSVSSNVPLQEHSSVMLSFHEAHKMMENKGKVLVTKSPTPTVKSLAELCKSYLIHLFSTLDNQASESDENDSITGSPKQEPK